MPAIRLFAGMARSYILVSRLHPQGVGRGCKAAIAATTTHHGNDN